MFITKVPKIYVCLFLCNDYERFKEQQRKQKIKEANAQLKEEYERSKNLYYLTGFSLEKVDESIRKWKAYFKSESY